MRLSIVSAIIGLSAINAAAQVPADPAATAPAEVRIAHLKPITLLYSQQQVVPADSGPKIGQTIHELYHSISEDKITPQGGAVLIYQNLNADPKKPVDIQIGLPVPPGTPPNDQYQVRQIDSPRSATMLYTGGNAGIGPAITQMYAQIIKAGNQPVASELHVRILYWEAENSDNNVLMLEIPVK